MTLVISLQFSNALLSSHQWATGKIQPKKKKTSVYLGWSFMVGNRALSLGFLTI
jgi:hypothetical protein